MSQKKPVQIINSKESKDSKTPVKTPVKIPVKESKDSKTPVKTSKTTVKVPVKIPVKESQKAKPAKKPSSTIPGKRLMHEISSKVVNISEREKLPQGLRVIEGHELEDLDEIIFSFSKWNKEIKRDRAFFGYEIDYTQPEAPLLAHNLKDDFPTALSEKTKKMGREFDFDCLILEKFVDDQGIGKHKLSEVCGEKVYMYFCGQDTNLLLYGNPEGKEWDEFQEEMKKFEEKYGEKYQKLTQQLRESRTDSSKKENVDEIREEISKMTSHKPKISYKKMDIYVPSGTLIEMDLEFRRNWEISIPKRTYLYTKETPILKKNYKLFTLTFSQYNSSLFKEYVLREEKQKNEEP